MFDNDRYCLNLVNIVAVYRAVSEDESERAGRHGGDGAAGRARAGRAGSEPTKRVQGRLVVHEDHEQHGVAPKAQVQERREGGEEGHHPDEEYQRKLKEAETTDFTAIMRQGFLHVVYFAVCW